MIPVFLSGFKFEPMVNYLGSVFEVLYPIFRTIGIRAMNRNQNVKAVSPALAEIFRHPSVNATKLDRADATRIVSSILLICVFDAPFEPLAWSVLLRLRDIDCSVMLTMSHVGGGNGCLFVESGDYGLPPNVTGAIQFIPTRLESVEYYLLEVWFKHLTKYLCDVRGCRWWCERFIERMPTLGIRCRSQFEEYINRKSEGKNPHYFPVIADPGQLDVNYC